MGGHLVLNILNNTLWKMLIIGFKNEWKTKGFKAFLIRKIP
jgi:hypothetical protein